MIAEKIEKLFQGKNFPTTEAIVAEAEKYGLVITDDAKRWIKEAVARQATTPDSRKLLNAYLDVIEKRRENSPLGDEDVDYLVRFWHHIVANRYGKPTLAEFMADLGHTDRSAQTAALNRIPIRVA